MSNVPSDPKEFFTEYLPSQFEGMKDKLAGKSSAGSMLFRILDGGEWSLSLSDGEITITEGQADDVIIQVTIPPDDFGAVMVEGAEAQGDGGMAPETQLMAFKALAVDEARAGSVRNVKGSVAFMITDGDAIRKLVITPGSQAPNMDAPECKLECQMSDFLQLQTGKALPMQLAMSGKIRIVGDASLPMALNAVLA